MAAIEILGVHKTFRLPHERRTTLAERVLGVFRPTTYERFEALRGVDLAVERGSFVGIIGSNGSGKSTLLKVIAGLLVPDGGEVRVDGSLAALLELGLGFSPELTVRENVELYGAVLGYPRREMTARIEMAIRFAELERFRDAKLKNLSTGMQMRLGFATALQARSDIMLLDEILAVGDASFQRKCLAVFSQMKERRNTVVLVSHDLVQVRRFCDHVILIDAGRVAAAGDADTVVAQYLQGASQTGMPAAARSAIGDGRALVRDGWLEDAGGARVTDVRSGDRPTLVLRVEAVKDLDDPEFGVIFRDGKGSLVYGINTRWLGLRTGRLPAGETLEVRVPFIAALRNGHYAIDAGVADRTGMVVHDWVHNVANLTITDSVCLDGAADLRAEFSWGPVTRASDRAGAADGEQCLGGGRPG